MTNSSSRRNRRRPSRPWGNGGTPPPSKYQDREKVNNNNEKEINKTTNFGYISGSGSGNSGREKCWKRKRTIIGILLLSVMAMGVYVNSLDGEFVHDDLVSIVRNPDVNGANNWTQLWTNDYWGMPMAHRASHKSYRPITIITFRLNHMVNNGSSSIWFHVTNLVIHALTTILVFQISRTELRMRFSTSLTTSSIFAVHPVHSEAVAGITGRADSLSCLLMLVSFLLYSRGGSTKRIILSGFFGCLAMLAKETGITILGIITLVDIYRHRKHLNGKLWFWAKSDEIVDPCQSQLRRRILQMVTMILVSIGVRLALLNGSLPSFAPQDNPAASADSYLTRFLTYAFLPVFNIWLILCPIRLSYDWQMGSIPLVRTLLDSRNIATAIFYLFFVLLLRHSFVSKARKSGLVVLVSMLFLLLPYLPASNLFFPVGFVAAERVLYTPSIGVCILTSHGIELLRRRLPRTQKFLTVVLCLMLISLSARTWDRNSVWKTRATLLKSGLKENPGNAKVHYNYANLQKDLGNVELAVKHYKIAIRLWPGYSSAHNNLGALAKDPLVAELCFLRAIEANSEHNGAHFNLAVTYMRSEKYTKALVHLEECLRIDPSHVQALQYLGACYNVLNKSEEAQNVYSKLINSDLPPSKLHTNFGAFLQELGLQSEALSHYLLALTKSSWDTIALEQGANLAKQLGSNRLFQELAQQLLSLKFDPGVAYMLAINYIEKGDSKKGSDLFELILQEETDSFYYIHYGQLLIHQKSWIRAEDVLKMVPSKDPNYPSSLLLLGQLYENLNKTSEALDTLSTAVQSYCPHEAQLCAQFYSQLGNLMHSTGSVLSAAAYYRNAIKLNPDALQAHTNIGAIYHLMNDYKRAEYHYSMALRLEPDNKIIQGNIKKLERAQSTQSSTTTTTLYIYNLDQVEEIKSLIVQAECPRNDETLSTVQMCRKLDIDLDIIDVGGKSSKSTNPNGSGA